MEETRQYSTLGCGYASLKTLLTRFVQVGSWKSLDVEAKPMFFPALRALRFNPAEGQETVPDPVYQSRTLRRRSLHRWYAGHGRHHHPRVPGICGDQRKQSARASLAEILHKGLKGIRKLHQRNDAKAARAHVHHHYDLSNELYKSFLDADMHYSGAYFSSEKDNSKSPSRTSCAISRQSLT